MSYQTVKLSKSLRQLEAIKRIQGTRGNWDYDPYMLGYFNGLELALAILQGREPEFKNAPDEWIKDKLDTTVKAVFLG